MAEEFEESEVIFCGDDDDYGENHLNFQEMIVSLRNNNPNKSSNKKKKKKRGMANSVPMNIPENMFRFEEDKNDCFDVEEEWAPPHLIVRRRITGGNMAYSVCTGNGRTLKGRDLSQVRNTILRMTGFLET